MGILPSRLVQLQRASSGTVTPARVGMDLVPKMESGDACTYGPNSGGNALLARQKADESERSSHVAQPTVQYAEGAFKSPA
jgi:hypothetical protein